jgi:rare lipoprotein A
LPFGQEVRVIRKDNNKSVKVRINDRGPFNRRRIIDLSKAAAKELGMLDDGVIEVTLEVLAD